MEEGSNLAWINSAVLSPVVRHATGRSCAEVTSWTVERIYGGVGKGLGVFRVESEGVDGSETFSSPLVVKIVGLGKGATDDPASWNYWKREALAFEGGTLERLPGGVVAPRCWGLSRLEDGAVGIWLEAIRDDGAPNWSLDDYNKAAYRFGRLNAAYLDGDRTLDQPWYSHDWLKGKVESCAKPVALLRENHDNPWIRRMYPPDILRSIVRIWDGRQWFYSIIDGLPQTFCHLDACRRNLFRRGGAHDETVVIDWAGSGIAPLGAEMGPFVAATIGFFEFDVGRWRELEDAAFGGYLKGLEEGAWKGDPRLVRLGYAASAVLCYGIPGPLQVATLLNEHQWPELERSIGRPIGELCDHWAQTRHSVLALAEEVQTLARDLGLGV